MSTLFILWPVTIDAAFRAAYVQATDETIQDNPPINSAGDTYMAGSSRARVEDCRFLKDLFPALVFGENPADLGWLAAPESDIF